MIFVSRWGPEISDKTHFEVMRDSNPRQPVMSRPLFEELMASSDKEYLLYVSFVIQGVALGKSCKFTLKWVKGLPFLKNRLLQDTP